MKRITNTKMIILIFGFFLALSPIITTNLNSKAGISNKNSEYSDNTKLDYENLKTSKISGKIHIINNSGWVAFRSAENCTGQGTYSDPYVIEDLEIDGGDSGSCIWIENSNVFFKIENCTVYNLGDISYAGIKLSHVNNSQLIENTVHTNGYGLQLLFCDNNTISGNTVYNNTDVGIELFSCTNNTISGNTINDNKHTGIQLLGCDNNTISENTVNNNQWYGICLTGGDNNNIYGNTANNNQRAGIWLYSSKNNRFSGNIMHNCGLQIYGFIEALVSNDIDTTNLVNGKLLYYYTNKIDLNSNNFTNAGQVIIINCNDSLISNLNVSYNSLGISLYYCNNNTLSDNTANYNYDYGIYLSFSHNNTISRNTANNNNDIGIYLIDSDYNTVSGNTASNNNYEGIRLSSSDSNTISGNTANNNIYGISLHESNYNVVSGNTLLGNGVCIEEYECQGNEFSDNGSCTYGQGDGEQLIPGYNLFLLLGILSVALILISKKLKKS